MSEQLPSNQGCAQHGYTNGVLCPMCDREMLTSKQDGVMSEQQTKDEQLVHRVCNWIAEERKKVMGKRDDLTSKELLPCAHCGGAAQLTEVEPMHYVVECSEPMCNMSTRVYISAMDDSRPLAIEAWNRRVAVEPPAERSNSDSEKQLRATAQQMLNDGYSHMLVDPLDILRLTGRSS